MSDFIEHASIWLSPSCGKCRDEERTWCSNPQEPCPECGNEWVRFNLEFEPTGYLDPTTGQLA